MNRRQKEVLKQSVVDEQDILNELRKNYTRALKEVKQQIKELQTVAQTSQSKAYQLEYQRQLQSQLTNVLNVLKDSNVQSISDYLKRCYETGFCGAMYDIAGQGMNMIVPLDPLNMIKAVSKTGDDIKLVNKIGVQTKRLKQQVLSELKRGISSNRSYAEIARNIANHGQADMNRSMLIARTEGHRIQNEAKMDAYQGAKKKGADIVKQWDCTLDGATRPHHRMLDGQIRELDEDFEVDGLKAKYPGDFGDPSEDCNCRCAMLQRARWGLDEEELKVLEERAKFHGLDKTQDFNEYKQKYLQASKKVLTEEQSGVKIKKNYSCDIATQFGADYYDEMHELINACDNEEARQIWEHYESRIKIVDPNYTGRAYASQGTIYVNAAQDRVGSYGKAKYQTTFHESGHAIDHLAKNLADGSNFFYSSNYKNGLFPKTIKEEVMEMVSKMDEKLKREFALHINDAQWMWDNDLVPYFNYSYFLSNGRWMETPKYRKSFAYAALQKQFLDEIDYSAIADFSDIVEGATRDRIHLGWGHGANYWNEGVYKGVEYMLGTESFAEMYDSLMTNKESLKVIKKYLPKSYSIFLDMLKEINSKIR